MAHALPCSVLYDTLKTIKQRYHATATHIMNKIKINTIPTQITKYKGFSSKGCLGTPCNDKCCTFGSDVDKESFELMHKHRPLLETTINRNLDDCFETWSGDDEYLGNNSIRSRVGEDGYCVFHNPEGKGCVLYMMVYGNNISRRLVPSICRLFPLTWQKGVLCFSLELGQDLIPPRCDLRRQEEEGQRTAMETQSDEFFDIFALEEPIAT